MACLVNSSAFAFLGTNPLSSPSNIPYRTLTTPSLQAMPAKQDDLRFPLVWKHRSTTQGERKKAFFSGKNSPIKSVQMQEALPEGLKRELMPKHVAIILDGSLRCFKERRLAVELNHLSGGRVIKKIAFLCDNWGIKIVSVFASSTENWDRPKVEYSITTNSHDHWSVTVHDVLLFSLIDI